MTEFRVDPDICCDCGEGRAFMWIFSWILMEILNITSMSYILFACLTDQCYRDRAASEHT